MVLDFGMIAIHLCLVQGNYICDLIKGIEVDVRNIYFKLQAFQK